MELDHLTIRFVEFWIPSSKGFLGGEATFTTFFPRNFQVTNVKIKFLLVDLGNVRYALQLSSLLFSPINQNDILPIGLLQQDFVLQELDLLLSEVFAKVSL